jgi:hypothetical protein
MSGSTEVMRFALQAMEHDHVGSKQSLKWSFLAFVCNRWSLWNESAAVGLFPVGPPVALKARPH